MKTRGANESRYVSALVQAPLPTKQNDQLARQGMVKDDQRHVRSVLATGKLYGPLSPEAQIKAVEYAYGIKMFR
jgi:hypothetical protein